MKYLPLVWARMRCRPVHPILTMISMAFAACLAGLVLAVAPLLPRSSELDMVVRAIAAGGFLLILLLTMHAVAHAVQAQSWEFALLRALGFSSPLVAGLLFLEVVTACLAGVVLGLLLAQTAFVLFCRLVFPPVVRLSILPWLPALLDLAAALFVAIASTALPAWRMSRLNPAATLARGPQ